MTNTMSLETSAKAQKLIGKEWISACEFREMTEGQVLKEVSRRVTELKARAGVTKKAHPLVLLDLDSTLYEVGPRTFQIIQEWIKSGASSEFPKTRAALATLKMAEVGYSLKETFATVGLDANDLEVAAALASAKPFWSERFFSSAYLPFDRAYEGAARFAQELHELGAELVYLTGRDEPRMGDGTRENLVRDGFPWEIERTHLLMKPAPEMEDLDHKKRAADYIREHGTLVASFENEPLNLSALYEIFPDAMHVFVDTVCSDHPAVPCRGLYRIAGFN